VNRARGGSIRSRAKRRRVPRPLRGPPLEGRLRPDYAGRGRLPVFAAGPNSALVLGRLGHDFLGLDLILRLRFRRDRPFIPERDCGCKGSFPPALPWRRDGLETRTRPTRGEGVGEATGTSPPILWPASRDRGRRCGAGAATMLIGRRLEAGYRSNLAESVGRLTAGPEQRSVARFGRRPRPAPASRGRLP
jgi:hypothetical protein